MRNCIFLILLLSSVIVRAQSDHLVDSLKKDLLRAHSDREKMLILADLANYYVTIDVAQAKSYGDQAMEVAELSRDRKLIATAWLMAGNRWFNKGGLEGSMTQAMDCFQRAEKISRENDLDEELGFAYIGMARAARGKGDYAQALNYNNQALSIAGNAGSDTLKVSAYNSVGNTYRYRNEKLLALRNYLDALNIAELSKNDALLKTTYTTLSDFYVIIEDFDKAIDYEMRIQELDRKNNQRYALLDDYNNTGRVFVRKKQMELARSMFEKAILLADSLQFPLYKINSWLNIANMYFNNQELQKGMDYLQSHQEVLDFMRKSDMSFFLDEGYAGIYSELGRYDSAYYYFKKAEPEFDKKGNPFVKYDFYRQFGEYYKHTKDYRMAIAYYLKAHGIGEATKDLRLLEEAAKNLDTLYEKAGDFKTAYTYNIAYHSYKDSIRNLAKEADLLKLEVDNDNKRRERLAKEDEERKLRRHNIQYMGFTAGIATLFIILVMLGFFAVSPRTIRAIGFFSFIFLFEFLILIADAQIHEATHGEPWKVLLIKIFLAAILLPLHHWLEHKVIHYLSTRKKFVPTGSLFFKRKSGASAVGTPGSTGSA